MRSAGNFSPEWGYLAPAPSFMRTARVVLVATAIGATAGAVVVLSLVDRPAGDGEKNLIAAHAIVTSVQAATATTIPVSTAPVAAVAAVAPTAPVAAAPVAAVAPTTVTAVVPTNAPTTDPATAPALTSSSGVAALSETPQASDAARSDLPDGTTLTPDTSMQKKASKHPGPEAPTNAKSQPNPGLGSVLRRMFSSRTGTSYYPAR
jgi:hypothetical protein